MKNFFGTQGVGRRMEACFVAISFAEQAEFETACAILEAWGRKERLVEKMRANDRSRAQARL